MTTGVSSNENRPERPCACVRERSYSLLETQRVLMSEENVSRGLNVEQVAVEFDEAIDENMFRASAQHVIRSHEALGVKFEWSKPEHPVQQVGLNLGSSVRTVQADGKLLEQVLTEERERGFDVSQPSQMRIVLLRHDNKNWGLVWTIHRAVADRASLEILLDQIFMAYQEILAGQQPAELEVTSLETPISREKDVDGEQQLGRDEVSKSIQQLLAGVDSPTPLPLNFKGLDRSHEISVVQQKITDTSYAQVRGGVLDADVSEDTIIQLAWAVVLGRYGAGSDVVFGGSASARDEESECLRNVVGPCSIRVPVVVQIDPDQTVCDALQALHVQQSAMVRTHGTAMQGILSSPTDVQTDVSYYRDRFASEPSKNGWRLQFSSISHWGCPLSLLVQDDGISLSVSLTYDTGLYTLQAATQLLNDYCHILVELTKDLNQPLRELDVLSPAMRERLIDQQCAREQVVPHPSALTRIMDQCDSRPDDLAVSDFHGSSVTYRELGQRVRQFAQTLRGHGVREGDIVAIHADRSIEFIVSMLATHAAGAAFLPLDVNSPAGRRIYMLEDAQVRLVLMGGSEDLVTDVQKLRVDEELDACSKSSLEELPSDPTPADGLAYVIYTSGSTGKPKGVCIEHSSLANHITQTSEQYGLSSEDRCLQFTSLSFDPSIEEIFVSLSMGASLWLRSNEMVNSARAFFEGVRKTNLTVVTLPTAFWHQLVHSQSTWPESVRLVLVGGERIDPGLHASFRELVDDQVRLVNCYGPTEVTIACTAYIDDEGDHDSAVLPIGRPLGGASCFVLDENLVPVPPGVKGQLYVGGAGLARGYLYRASLTAERFIDHPFRPNARLHATGDLVRHTAKGNLVYIDRIDHLVKVNGFRVELGEIETRLRTHQAVEEAVVVPVSLGGSTRLVAFVQSPDQDRVDGNELREFVGSKLPAYMVPRRIEVLSALPQTPAGKVDRQTLVAMSTELSKHASTTQNSTAEVSDPLHEKLLGIWSEMLKEPIKDPRADFFAVGGDSLLAVRLFVEIERELQIQCNPQKFFNDPTVEALAKLIRSNDITDFKDPLLTLAQEPADVRPLFFAPTVSGQVTDYFYLFELLKGTVPMYGLQMRGLRDGEEIHDNLREAAEFYIERMREIQPKGPYSLAGYSAGGTVCLAIAETLHEQGETTDLVLMLDAVPPAVHIASPFGSPRRMWRLGRTAIDRFKELFQEEQFFRHLIKRGKPVMQRLWAKIWPSAQKPYIHVEDLFIRSGMSELTPEESVRMQAHLDTTIDFQPRRYPLDVVLVRSIHDPFEGPFELDLGWKQAITGNIEIEVVPVRHNDFLDKNHIQLVAGIMKDHLNSRIDTSC